MLNWPPISAAASKRSTACPRSASSVAQARPAGPAPTTATFFRVAAGFQVSSVSWQARGFTRQVQVFRWKTWSRQAWLQAMQVLISSARPAAALLTSSGSARKGRAIETMSASPSASTFSATSGVLMRFVVQTGMPTSPFSLRVTQVKAPRGTEVAMVGTRASCQPMPVLRMVDPGRLERPGELDHLVPGAAVGDEVEHGEAEDHDEVAPHRLAEPGDDLHRQPHAVLVAPAPAVGAPVGARGQELVHEVPLRAHHLDAVVAGLAGQRAAAGEGPDLPLHPGRGEFTWREWIDGGLDARGGHREGVVAVAAAVEDLQRDLAALGVDGVGDGAVGAGRAVGGQPRAQRGEPALHVGGEAARHHESDPAPGPLGEVGGQAREVPGPVLEPGVHGAHEHPVRRAG